jgi:hypothetical protein
MISIEKIKQSYKKSKDFMSKQKNNQLKNQMISGRNKKIKV